MLGRLSRLNEICVSSNFSPSHRDSVFRTFDLDKTGQEPQISIRKFVSWPFL